MKSTLNLKKYKISETLELIRKEKELSILDFSNLCGLETKIYSRMIKSNYSFEKNQVRDICKNIGIPFNAFLVRSLDVNKIKDKERKRLMKNIKPMINEIAKALYSNNDSILKNIQTR